MHITGRQLAVTISEIAHSLLDSWPMQQTMKHKHGEGESCTSTTRKLAEAADEVAHLTGRREFGVEVPSVKTTHREKFAHQLSGS